MAGKASIIFADAEMYIIRDDEVWANVVIDEDTGTFMALGSNGVFAASWADKAGRSLKDELLGLSFDRFCTCCGREAADPQAVSFWRTIWPHVIWATGGDVFSETCEPSSGRA